MEFSFVTAASISSEGLTELNSYYVHPVENRVIYFNGSTQQDLLVFASLTFLAIRSDVREIHRLTPRPINGLELILNPS